ncbi:MAG: hemerythrin family protein [Alphaproteobacteria bacterium]|nr:hemerythrin family protein [Alphaproteobacteria bacterium]MBF0252131.1 hemerythrin family protein [Alphaproteobacteria bacterium]
MSYRYLPDNLVLSIEVIDNDHDRLFGLLDMLNMSIADRDVNGLHFILNDVADYVRFHFSREEAGLTACGYAALDGHLDEHERLREQVRGLMDDLERNPATFDEARLNEIQAFFREWLDHHIAVVDMAYRDAMLASPEALEEMQKFSFAGDA